MSADLQLSAGIWFDIEETGTLDLEKGDFVALARQYERDFSWSTRAESRKAYERTHPDYLKQVDRRYALAQRIIDTFTPEKEATK